MHQGRANKHGQRSVARLGGFTVSRRFVQKLSDLAVQAELQSPLSSNEECGLWTFGSVSFAMLTGFPLRDLAR